MSSGTHGSYPSMNGNSNPQSHHNKNQRSHHHQNNHHHQSQQQIIRLNQLQQPQQHHQQHQHQIPPASTTINAQHDDLIKYIFDSWDKVNKEFNHCVRNGGTTINTTNNASLIGSPLAQQPITVAYYQEPPNTILKDFQPFDLEAWWGKKLVQNLTQPPPPQQHQQQHNNYQNYYHQGGVGHSTQVGHHNMNHQHHNPS